jgi:hypothetical protein
VSQFVDYIQQSSSNQHPSKHQWKNNIKGIHSSFSSSLEFRTFKVSIGTDFKSEYVVEETMDTLALSAGLFFWGVMPAKEGAFVVPTCPNRAWPCTGNFHPPDDSTAISRPAEFDLFGTLSSASIQNTQEKQYKSKALRQSLSVLLK